MMPTGRPALTFTNRAAVPSAAVSKLMSLRISMLIAIFAIERVWRRIGRAIKYFTPNLAFKFDASLEQGIRTQETEWQGTRDVASSRL
jgi:hypothetical protein